jgi:hypothetical protein
LATWIRSKSQHRYLAALLIIFNTASFVGVFPRVDLAHILPTLPMTLISTAWGISQFQKTPIPRLSHYVYALCTLWLSLGVFALIGRPIRWISRDAHQLSRIPHFRAQLLPETYLYNLRATRDITQSTLQDEPLFFLTPAASSLYLVTDRPNPTPYDYPLLTAFGSDGQEQVIEQIQNGEFSWICFVTLRDHPLRPKLLEEFVKQNMLLVQKTQRCTLYQFPAEGVP